jgi:hypothetical protein
MKDDEVRVPAETLAAKSTDTAQEGAASKAKDRGAKDSAAMTGKLAEWRAFSGKHGVANMKWRTWSSEHGD